MWYKWYGEKWLSCETRSKLTPIQRLIYRELIDIASLNTRPGFVANPLGGGFGSPELARKFGVTPKTLNRLLDKLSPDVLFVHPDGVIEVKEWLSYQSDKLSKREYDRNRYLTKKMSSQGVHNELTPLDLDIDKDEEGEKRDSTSPPPRKEMKNFRPANLPPAFRDEFTKLFRKCFSKETPVIFIVDEGEAYAEKYGKEKLFDMMTQKAGKRWLYVKKDLDNPRNKPSRREATIVENILLICPGCKKNALRNASGTSFLCGSCDERFNVPTDMEGITITDLPEEVQDILNQLDKRKENVNK